MKLPQTLPPVRWLSLTLAALATSLCPSTAAPAPMLIPFQGRLTDQAGVAYTNGTYTIVFNLYDQPVGGNNLWTERHERVGVINGMVNVFLGSITPLDNPGQDRPPVNFSETRHLGITIDADLNPATADPEMIPRQMIIPAFWAKNSDKLQGSDWSAILASGDSNPQTGKIEGAKIKDESIPGSKIVGGTILGAQIGGGAITGAQIANGTITGANVANETIAGTHIANGTITDQQLGPTIGVPPGTIVAFGGRSLPPGWLRCNGAPFDPVQYPRLYDAIQESWGGVTISGKRHFRVPDLRGLFLRGVSEGEGTRDPERGDRTAISDGGNPGDNVGSFQDWRVGDHVHLFDDYYWSETGSPSGIKDQMGAEGGPLDSFDNDNGPKQSWTHFSHGAGGVESRPKNAYVHYIIKH